MRFNPEKIVRIARESMSCSKCGAAFGEGQLDLIDTVGQKGIFACNCLRCGTSSLTVTSLRDFERKVVRREDQIKKVSVEKVSPADVVDMKSFLDRFDGDFSQLVQRIEQPEIKSAEPPAKQPKKKQDSAS